MSDDTNSVAEWLAQHPKMTGVLFTMMLLLTQAGSVVASNGTGTAGP